MMERKSKKMKVWALVAAMVAATSGYGFALDLPGMPDTTVGSVQVTDWAYVGEDTSSSGTSTDNGAVGEYDVDVVADVTNTTTTIIQSGTTTTETTTSTGAVLAEATGDLTLAAGSETVESWTVDFARRVVVDLDSDSPTYGQVIEDTTVAGTWDGETFTQVGPDGVDPATFDATAYAELANEPVVTPGTGGNLTMDGNLSVGGNADMTGGKISNLAAGVAATDAANVGQVTAVADDLAEEVTARIADVDDEEERAMAAEALLQADIDQEIADRTALIREEEDGIHIGADSLVYAENYFPVADDDDTATPIPPAGDRLFTSDGGGIAVTETFSVKPAESVTSSTTVTPGEGTLPRIDNGEGTSTVFTRTGDVEVETLEVVGGGVVMETNGDVTLSQVTTEGVRVEYITATQFLVDNETGEPIPGTIEYVGGYLDEDRNFVVLGELNEDGLLDLEELEPAELDAISRDLRPTTEGGNLTVGGNAEIGGNLNMTNGKITNVADGTNARDAVNKGQMDAADAALQANIDAETSARISADEDLQDQIDDLDDEMDAIAAMSAAMSALVPNDRAAGNTQISLGLGTYDGATAGALGLFHYVNDNILINAGASADFEGDGEVAGRAGITIGF